MQRILQALGAIKAYEFTWTDRMKAGSEEERGHITVTILCQTTLFSHSISHSFPNELNGLRAECHLFKPDEVEQKIDLPGGQTCAHAKLDRCCALLYCLDNCNFSLTVK